MARNKRIAKNEFRYNYFTKHYNYIFEEEGLKYRALGLTTKEYTRDKKKKWHKNMLLKENPKKNDSGSSYIRYGYISQNKKTFGRIDKRFSITEANKSYFKAKIRYFKNSRRKRK